jgi:hypothetical protein
VVDTNNTVTTLVDNGDGSFTYTSEDGTVTTFTETLSTLVDNGDSTFTYTNENATITSFDGTDDQTAAEVTYDNTTSGLTAADTQAAIDELAVGSTDDQNISGSGLSGTDLTIGIEGGTNETVDVSSLVGTDDQLDSEVDLATDIDVDEGGVVSPTLETTVQEVIQAIAPITSKAARIFYPPSIAVDASSAGPGTPINLHQQYLDQYGMTLPSSAKSPTAPAAIPTYLASELYYYVTYYDPAVFSSVSITDAGIMSFTVLAPPVDYNSLINVVFVVK